MTTKHECDRCHRQFEDSRKLTAVRLGDLPTVRAELCHEDVRDLGYWLKERMMRDAYGNEIEVPDVG